MLMTQCYGNNEITRDYAYKENMPKSQQWLYLGDEIWGDFYSYPPIFSVLFTIINKYYFQKQKSLMFFKD